MPSTKWGSAIIAVTLLAGCASITRGTTENVTFTSEPAGAVMHAMIEPPCGHGCSTGRDTDMHEIQEPKIGPSCITPCALPVPRNEVWILTFSLPGYAQQTVRLGQKVAAGGVAGVAGNAIIGGGIGLFTDAATGAGYDHEPNPVAVKLQSIEPAKPSKLKRG